MRLVSPNQNKGGTKLKRMRIPMTLALGAALTIAPLSFASAEENPGAQISRQQQPEHLPLR